MAHPSSRSMTRVGEPEWIERPGGYRAWEQAVRVGTGDAYWHAARLELLRWGVKTRSGFTVEPDAPVSVGARPVIIARPLGLAIREPVEVVEVIDTECRVGFAYRTLPGHPVSGEEAFILTRDEDASSLTIRSLTRPGDRLGWRLAFPALLVAQRLARRRYLRALLPDRL